MKASRSLLAALLVANLGYFTWANGGLAMFGMLPASFAEHEPQRMTQQIRPGALQVLKEPRAAVAPAAPAVPATPVSTPDPESR